jgi:hypothetical protein
MCNPDEDLNKIKVAYDDYLEAKKNRYSKCTCDGFTIQYNNGCQCKAEKDYKVASDWLFHTLDSLF